MNCRKIFVSIIVLTASFALTAAPAAAITVDEALEKLKTHRFGQNDEALNLLYESAVASHSNPALRKKLNDGFTRVLESDAPYDAKEFACRQLALTATVDHIEVLGKRLTDEKMSHMALYALRHIDSPDVDKVLLAALDKADGRAKLGIIHLLGTRRCEAAIRPLGSLMLVSDQQVSIAAIEAIGRIGTKAAYSRFLIYDASEEEPSKIKALALERAILNCADALLESGESGTPLKIYSYALKAYSPTNRAAALKGLARVDPQKAVPMIADSLDHSDRPMRQMAVRLAQEIPGKDATKMLAGRLISLEPKARVSLLHALAVRKDNAALPAVMRCCSAADGSVRIAALEAVGVLGDASVVESLALHAARARGDERGAARSAMQSLRGAGVNPAMAKLLESAPDSARVELIGALAGRNATEAKPAIFETAAGGNAQVRIASRKALRTLSGPEDIGVLLDLLESAAEEDIDEAAKTVALISERFSIAPMTTTIVLKKLAKARDSNLRVAMLILLGGLGDSRALPALRAGLSDSDSRVQDAAVRGLSQWPDAAPNGEPMDDLLNIAQTSKIKAHRVLALRGYLNLITTAENLSPAQQAQACRKAIELAEGPGEKTRALSKTAELNSIEALEVAGAYLDDSSLKNEAAAAAVTIAQKAFSQDLPRAKAILKKVLETDVAQGVRQKASAILLNIDSIKDYLVDWEVTGPYVKKDKSFAELFDIPFGPEISGADVEWRAMPVTKLGSHPAYLDLLEELDGGDLRVAYLRTTIRSDSEVAVTFEMYTDDGVKAWLNGKLIHALNAARAIPANPDIVNATLKKGKNELMLKITQNNMPWGAIVLLKRPAP